MQRIKRTKQAPPALQVKDGRRVEIPGPSATHYAAAVTPQGAVEKWSADAAGAVAVTEAVAGRVRSYYAGKPNVGTLVFEACDATSAQIAEAVAADDRVGAAEFAALQKRCQRLLDENADLEDALKREKSLLAESRAAAERASAGVGRIRDLEEQLSAASKRNAEMAAKLADLEAKANEGKPAEPPMPALNLGKKK